MTRIGLGEPADRTTEQIIIVLVFELHLFDLNVFDLDPVVAEQTEAKQTEREHRRHQ